MHGQYPLTLRADYRFTLPPPWRAAFVGSMPGLAFVTRRDPDCWRIYPAASWHDAIAEFADKTPRQNTIEATDSVFLDARGRLTILPGQRACILCDPPFPAVLVGLGAYAELWHAVTWEREWRAATAMPPALKGLDLE